MKTALLQQLIQGLRKVVRALASASAMVRNVLTTPHYYPSLQSHAPSLLSQLLTQQHSHPAPSQHRIRGHRPTLASA